MALTLSDVGVWTYQHALRSEEESESEIRAAARAHRSCVYCKEPLRGLRLDGSDEASDLVEVCDLCGWWRNMWWRVQPAGWLDCYGNFGVLQNLDLTDLEVPLDQVRRYLLARFERRFEMHPRLLEHTVADLMREFGYEAEVTAYSGDGGIDVILRDGDGTIGVQVKRHRKKIEVEQIRALTGALVIAGQTRGIFVTTSAFQPGAHAAAARSGRQGVPIELLDAERFLSALRVGSRPPYETFDEWRSVVGDPQALRLPAGDDYT